MTARQLHRAEALWRPSEPIIVGPETWMTLGRCAETDPDAFFPEKGEATKAAKRICATCPVAAECLEYALRTDQRFGVWGGKSEPQRRKIRKQRRQEVAA